MSLNRLAQIEGIIIDTEEFVEIATTRVEIEDARLESYMKIKKLLFSEEIEK